MVRLFTGSSPPLSESFHPPSLTSPLVSRSFTMSKNNIARSKMPSGTSSKTASNGTRARRDIDLSEDPRNILPSNVQRQKKGTTKQMAMSKYSVISISNVLTCCI